MPAIFPCATDHVLISCAFWLQQHFWNVAHVGCQTQNSMTFHSLHCHVAGAGLDLTAFLDFCSTDHVVGPTGGIHFGPALILGCICHFSCSSARSTPLSWVPVEVWCSQALPILRIYCIYVHTVSSCRFHFRQHASCHQNCNNLLLDLIKTGISVSEMTTLWYIHPVQNWSRRGLMCQYFIGWHCACTNPETRAFEWEGIIPWDSQEETGTAHTSAFAAPQASGMLSLPPQLIAAGLSLRWMKAIYFETWSPAAVMASSPLVLYADIS